MTTYYVDDGGSNTSPYDTWAKAAPSAYQLIAGVTLAAGDIVYVGHDSNDPYTHTASLTLGNSSIGDNVACVQWISATQGSSPPTYQKGTGSQIDTTESTSYTINFAGPNAFFGIRFKPGGHLQATGNYSHTYMNDCDLVFTAGRGWNYNNSNAYIHAYKVNFDCSADVSNQGTILIPQNSSIGLFTLDSCIFTSVGYRSGLWSYHQAIIGLQIKNCDLSGFTRSGWYLVGEPLWGNYWEYEITNCKMPSGWTPIYGGYETSGPVVNGFASITISRCGNTLAEANTQLYFRTHGSTIVATPSIYRSSGGQIESTSWAWLMTTNATSGLVRKHVPRTHGVSPWIYGEVTSTGSKTFDVYITNDSADFNDDEVWLELEYRGASSSNLGYHSDDRYTLPLGTPAAQTDDTSSTWNGTGPSFTYKQKLSITATVNTTGIYRVRVVCAVGSIASSRYFYIDPLVTIT